MSEESQEHQIIQKAAHVFGEVMDSTLHDLPLPVAIPAVMAEGIVGAPVLLGAFAVDEVNEYLVQPIGHLFGGDSVDASVPNLDLPTEEPIYMPEYQTAHEDPPPPPSEE